MKYLVFVLTVLVAANCFAEEGNVIATKQYVEGGVQYAVDYTDKQTKDLVNKADPLLNTIPVGKPEGEVPDGRVIVWLE